MQSVSGLMGVTGEVGGGPLRIGVPIADYTTGLFALSGVLAALHVREQMPEGQHVKVAMLDASLNMLCNYIPSVADLGAKIPRLGRGHAQIVPYQAYLCADGEYVMVGAFTRNFWLRLCEALERPELDQRSALRQQQRKAAQPRRADRGAGGDLRDQAACRVARRAGGCRCAVQPGARTA